MLKKVKFNNSFILLIGLLIITLGVGIGFYEYFIEEKSKIFSDMNILLYENEIPQIINSDEEIKEKTEEETTVDTNTEKPAQNQETLYNFIGVLEIPKINLKRGFLDLNSKYNNVDYNITLISGSTFPDEENNNLILASHSGNCTVCFFNQLYQIGMNDIAYVYYKGIKYAYKVADIYEVSKVGTVAIRRNYSKSTLTLITCTRNSNTKQTIYILELTAKENY